MEKYNHIEFERESILKKYRFRQFPNAPQPPVRNRREHGKKLSNDIENTVTEIEKFRVDHGIDSKKLIVLEIEGDSISSDIIDRFLRSFNVSLVEENVNNDERFKSRLVVQFDSYNDIMLFDSERQLFEDDSKDDNILTYAQRRDLFNCISNIRQLNREDRMGSRLKEALQINEDVLEGTFNVDIDVWYNGKDTSVFNIEQQIKNALGTGGSELLGDLFELPSLLLGRVKVNRFSLNALLDLDIIAQVELPIGKICTEPYELYDISYRPVVIDELDENAPIAAVIDSGVYSANPLLSSIIIAEEEFDQTENTTNDINGHGTGVAGIVAYGDLSNCYDVGEFKPQVRILNGKVLHNDERGDATFPEDKRPEIVVKEAIEFFYQNYGCRVFNLSLGDCDHVYSGGRQFAWAEILDKLIRELDIVIIVSAGNVIDPQMSDFNTREELMQNTQNRLFYPEHRLIDPATSAMAITVGSISRFNQPQAIIRRGTRISIGEKDHLSAFTRIGKGVNKAIKPEVVDYGGNFAVHQFTRGQARWVKNDSRLLEPTLNNTSDRIFKGFCGTSFSAPHVTNYTARIEKALEDQLEKQASSNLIRAMVINTSEYTKEAKQWYESSVDSFYSGNANPKQERRMRLAGFGKANDDILFSRENYVTVFAEDELELRSFHLFKIPVPKEFLNVSAYKKISISLAYNPSTRISRKEYLTNNIWFEVFRKIDEDTLLKYKEKKERGDNIEADRYLDSLPENYKAKFYPGAESIKKGTLQQRVWEKGPRGGSDLLWDVEVPYIYVIVTGKELFKFSEQEIPQKYALVITFSYQSTDNIGLYNSIKNQIKIKERETARERVQNKLR